MKILVVEDEYLVACDLQETLEYLGYEVPMVVDSGEDALLKIPEIQPDLILMDILLSGELDGIETADIIKNKFNIPVVYLTANADRQTLDRVKQSQQFGYILKPYDERTLAITIEISIARHQAELDLLKALNITEQKQKDAELESQLKSKYLSIAAHDFRNPIATILMGARFLEKYDHNLSEEKKAKYLKIIQSSSEDINQIIDNILTLSQGESHKLEFDPLPINIVEICASIVEKFKLVTTETNHEISFLSDGLICIINIDKILILQMLTNLLSNAIRYSPEGGEVKLTISWDNEYVYLQVQDQGIGIPEEAKSRLFLPFERGDNVGEIHGTGLGLAIVKQCVDLHQGKIFVDSKINQGTNFKITLPRIND